MEEAIVGRAELKLKGAIEAFGYDFRGKTVLDIGSSTGGFTELALRKGAERVIAVEKGTRQMKAPLRFDPRVELHEKTDFFELVNRLQIHAMHESAAGRRLGKTRASSGFRSAPTAVQVETVLTDVSFVSLRLILEHARKIFPKTVDYLVMLKPQFEAKDFQLNRGVVKNEKMRREIIKDFENWLKQKGFGVVKKRDNEIRGKVGGNQERFYWLRVIY